jgi:hypothetical protein
MIMKKLFLISSVSFICILFSCMTASSLKPKQIAFSDKCEILDSILNDRVLMKVIGIDSAKSNYPSIRFIDTKAKDFAGCDIMHRVNSNILPFSGFVIPEPTYSLNTGQFRDIVLFDYNVQNDTINLSLTAAYFENQAKKEGIPYFQFKMAVDQQGKVRIVNVDKELARERHPSVDYDKIKE